MVTVNTRLFQKTVACITTKGEVINMTWKSDGSTIALGNKDDLVCFVDYKTHKIIADKQFDFEVNEIGWNNTDEHFYLTSGDFVDDAYLILSQL